MKPRGLTHSGFVKKVLSLIQWQHTTTLCKTMKTNPDFSRFIYDKIKNQTKFSRFEHEIAMSA